MDREKLFEEFINECEGRGEICGQGNPNSDILIIGQEPYNEKELRGEDLQEYLRNKYKDCRDPYRRFFVHPSKGLSPTWRNYQRLIEKTYPNKPNHFNTVDFEVYAFTTELNKIPRPHKCFDEETQKNVRKRLSFFKESNFIKSFNIVILACGSYIPNNEEQGYLINDTFGVEFDIKPKMDGKPIGEHKYNSGHWFFTHHGDEGKKLVIHTRQLSNLNNYHIIDDMADEINNHLKKLGII